tara:strand:+ start:357 stop:2120 length:1764 start_codon:yes stop_codon:yes gene_type:complete
MNYYKYNYGENGHIQHTWDDHNLNTKINQFFFQLVRTHDNEDLYDLEYELTSMLEQIFDSKESLKKYKNELIKLYQIAGHTRDIIRGKGERDLSYMQIYNWYKMNRYLGEYLLRCCVMLDEGKHPYGSWKDIKKISQYIYLKTNNKHHPFINSIVTFVNEQLLIDMTNYDNNKNISLLAKWLPRKSKNNKKYGWLFEKLAYDMYSYYFKNIKNKIGLRKAKNKAEMAYRTILSRLNFRLGTIEINQCSNNWRLIDLDKVPSLAMNRYYYSFYFDRSGRDLDKFPSIRLDREKCRNNFLRQIESNKFNTKNIQPYQIIHEIIHKDIWNYDKNMPIRKYINSIWNTYTKQNKLYIKKIIPFIDTSFQMEKDKHIPLYNSIALGIRISEIEVNEYKNRIIMFDSIPRWIIFDETDDICDKVNKIVNNSLGCNSDFYKSLRLILDTVCKENIHNNEIKNTKLIIFSDMQIENNSPILNRRRTTLHNTITKIFENIGINGPYKNPYKCPTIIFWNLRKTNGFPCDIDSSDVSIMGGYSDKSLVYLNNTPKSEISTSKKITSYHISNGDYNIKSILKHHRYYCLEKKINDFLN